MTVKRGGTKEQVSIMDLVVGDVVALETGDSIPADGVLIRGSDVKVDESSMTGESASVVVPATHC